MNTTVKQNIQNYYLQLTLGLASFRLKECNTLTH